MVSSPSLEGSVWVIRPLHCPDVSQFARLAAPGFFGGPRGEAVRVRMVSSPLVATSGSGPGALLRGARNENCARPERQPAAIEPPRPFFIFSTAWSMLILAPACVPSLHHLTYWNPRRAVPVSRLRPCQVLSR